MNGLPQGIVKVTQALVSTTDPAGSSHIVAVMRDDEVGGEDRASSR
jgi:hypothetical protein